MSGLDEFMSELPQARRRPLSSIIGVTSNMGLEEEKEQESRERKATKETNQTLGDRRLFCVMRISSSGYTTSRESTVAIFRITSEVLS